MSKYKVYKSGKSCTNWLASISVLLMLVAVSCSNHEASMNQEKVILVDLEYAENFTIYSTGQDTIIQVLDGKNTWDYRVSKKAKEGEIILPVESVICLSTSHLYFFSEIDGLAKIKAVSFAENIADENVAEALKVGSIKELNRGSDYNAELVLEIHPDLFTTYPFGNDEFQRINDSGIPSLHFTEYLESHPLGRAEWIKLVGFLLGKPEEANEYFENVENHYLEIKDRVKKSKKKRPSVINANGYENSWTAPNGNSLVSNFIHDAGGDYVFKENVSEGNLTVDFEKICELANSSDYWASVIFDEEVTIESFTGDEMRLKETNVMREGNIFYCNAQKRDYFGKGIMQPHLMLEDIYQVLYDDSLGYVPHYFERFHP